MWYFQPSNPLSSEILAFEGLGLARRRKLNDILWLLCWLIWCPPSYADYSIFRHNRKRGQVKKYIFKIIQTPYRVSFIWTGFLTFYWKWQSYCADISRTHVHVMIWDGRMHFSVMRGWNCVADHKQRPWIPQWLIICVWVTSNPYWRLSPGQDWEGSLSLSLTHRKSERHGAISPGKRLQNHTDLLTVAVSSIFISWFPSAEQTGDLLSCMHTSLGLCTQICCLHIGKCSLPHSVDFTVGFGTLQIKSKITFCHVKNRLSVSSAISKADSEWFTNSHITFTWKHHRVCGRLLPAA